MAQANHPSKYVIREYLERRSHETKPPPSLEEIRRQLGWGLLVFDPLDHTDGLQANPSV
jgi:hypothetical protein